MDKVEEQHQYKLAIQHLMESAGMRVLKSDLNDDIAFANAEVGRVTKKFVNQNSLAELNYNLGLKAGLEMVLNRLANYEDDLIGDDVKPPKK